MVNAHCLRSMHLKHAVNSHSTRPIFDNPLLICIVSCVDWAPCKCDWGELRVNEFGACAVLVPSGAILAMV